MSVVILFPHMRVFALTLWGKRYSRIVAFPIGEGGPRQRRSGTLINCLLEMISPALFYPAFPIQPPPLRGTSFHRKEGASTRAPSLGRGCRAQRGGVGFLFCGEAASSLPSPLGTQRRSGALASGALETIFPALFHTASTLSGSLRSPPSPRGEGFVCRCWFFCVSCIRFGYIGLWLAALAFCANKNRSARTGFAERFWFYYSTVTDFARFLGLSTSFPLLIEV